MKVEFCLEMILYDERNNNECIEIVRLRHISQMSFVPQIGIEVLIGKGEDELSQHEVKDVMWIENDDSLYIELRNYETEVGENESYERGLEYFDGMKKRFVEDDGWKIIEVRSKRQELEKIK